MSHSSKLKAVGATDIGMKRSVNQDSILVDLGLGLFIVADGMGGHKGGEIASSMAVASVQEIIKTFVDSGREFNPAEVLVYAYLEASTRIYNRSLDATEDLKGMGTTMVAMLFHQDHYYVANVGDSRGYLFRNPNLWQLTEDHSLINEHLRAGLIDESQIKSMVARNVITRSVGYEKIVQADIVKRKVQPNETILLCSDGLSGLISDKKIASIVFTKSIQEAVPKLIDEAKKAGGDDNISVILIKT